MFGEPRRPPEGAHEPAQHGRRHRPGAGRRLEWLLLGLVAISALILMTRSERSGAFYSDRDAIRGNRLTMAEKYPGDETATPTRTPVATGTRTKLAPGASADTPTPTATACEALARGCAPTRPFPAATATPRVECGPDHPEACPTSTPIATTPPAPSSEPPAPTATPAPAEPTAEPSATPEPASPTPIPPEPTPTVASSGNRGASAERQSFPSQ